MVIHDKLVSKGFKSLEGSCFRFHLSVKLLIMKREKIYKYVFEAKRGITAILSSSQHVPTSTIAQIFLFNRNVRETVDENTSSN